REAGFAIEPENVRVEPVLAGEEWERMSMEEFWQKLPSADAMFAQRRAAAEAAGHVLCYLGITDADGGEVRLAEVEQRHPAARLSPGDNLIAVTSARYSERPLVIGGPGAGPEVTAAGVFADIIRAAVESR
ncbi:MAG: bifunctional aspartate kinase/homoserine dehydrogenase I, partial [Longimicrobiales bacterium]